MPISLSGLPALASFGALQVVFNGYGDSCSTSDFKMSPEASVLLIYALSVIYQSFFSPNDIKATIFTGDLHISFLIAAWRS
jgi:hypothetical protein